MKKYLFIATAIFCFATSFTYKNKRLQTHSLENHIDSLFQNKLKEAKLAGGVIFVQHKDSLLLNKAYGNANQELSVTMNTNTQFEIGSVTKQFTAAAILKLVEAKKLSLNDDFTDYLEFDTRGRKITINNLLNHTSGIPSYTEIPEFWNLSLKTLPRDSLVRLVEQKDFLFEPNEALIYNNSAYFFLGLIIEKITGQRYEDYLEEQFFEPLGMHNTNYCSSKKLTKNKANGYSFTPNGLAHKSYLDHTWPFSAGSLCSTAGDVLIWMNALHKGQVLSKTSYDLLITPDKLKDGTTLSYAKGLVNFKNYGHRQIAHGGGIPGFLSETRFYPDDDLYIICLLNTTGPVGATYFANSITWNLLKKEEYPTEAQNINLKKLTGTYTGAGRGATQSVEVKKANNQLTLKRTGKDKVDTLKTYIGNNTWMMGNKKVTIKNNQYRADYISGYYVLNKE